MGLHQKNSEAKPASDFETVKRIHANDKIIAFAGNPNVGKSTIFNYLTGLKQHTGNWPGKTVTNASGVCSYNKTDYILVDLPGSYSIMAHSAEEEVARDFICFGDIDYVVVICDATCLERNLNLALQIIEMTPNVLICVNLMDQAEKKNISLSLDSISEALGVPVIATSARNKNSIYKILPVIEENLTDTKETIPIRIEYPNYIETAIDDFSSILCDLNIKNLNIRWLSLRILEGDETLLNNISTFLGFSLLHNELVASVLKEIHSIFEENHITKSQFKDAIISSIINTAENVCRANITSNVSAASLRDRKVDKVLTSKWFGFPIMFLILLIIFWITITGANYPSEVIANGLFFIEDQLLVFLHYLGVPKFIYEMLVLGIYHVLSWVVSVMLPPMAIFFPLFTLLEDFGYLPRVAFNLDKCFKKCSACGKQALTMCMGLGCNAVGIIGCRIIDSPRERLIAIITNNFIPCNGRFPTLLAIISMFFIATNNSLLNTLLSALLLTLLLLLGIFMTFLISKILSKSLLKGIPTSFTLELPPYRKPQILKVITRSIFDRTLFVLGRAVKVAAPAGLLLWILANIYLDGTSLLNHCSNFLDPLGRFMGIDGVILLAFILGMPANEIVMPIIIMSYLSQSTISEYDSLFELKQLLLDHGWTFVTATSTMLFSLMHWPCSTTCLTIKKETGSIKWTIVSFLIPTISGILLCSLFANIVRLFV